MKDNENIKQPNDNFHRIYDRWIFIA